MPQPSPTAPTVDVALNIFARPYQTALSLISLLRVSDARIGKIFLQFEPYGSAYDKVQPYIMADYLGDRAVVHQPEIWISCDAVDQNRLDDPAYRLSVRYQHAFEASRAKYLFITHNDVLFKKDLIGAMLDNIGDAFAIGQVGQCWNCPACNAGAVRAAGLGETPCAPERYAEFRPDLASLQRLYQCAAERGVFVRSYAPGFADYYNDGASRAQAWPLPECRVNEWGCLINLDICREHVMPHGKILPFGAYLPCGPDTCLDISVPWFRGLHRLGLRAKHMDISPYLTHWVGSDKTTERRYVLSEDNARGILLKSFKPFVEWCAQRKNNLF